MLWFLQRPSLVKVSWKVSPLLSEIPALATIPSMRPFMAKEVLKRFKRDDQEVTSVGMKKRWDLDFW
jgi:hypothetical protein